MKTVNEIFKKKDSSVHRLQERVGYLHSFDCYIQLFYVFIFFFRNTYHYFSNAYALIFNLML